jgi:hypothetical protein
MKHFLLFLILAAHTAEAQKLKKADKLTVQNLKTHIGYLADDKLEGRRAGSAGERLAADYLSGQFKSIGLIPKGSQGGYEQPFEIVDGKIPTPGTQFTLNQQALKTGEEFFPLPFSPNSGLISASVSPSLAESGQPWFLDLGDILQNNKENPHFDLAGRIRQEIKNASDKGANALILYNSSDLADNIMFDEKDKSETVSIPVFFLTKQATQKYLVDPSAVYELKLKSELGPKTRQGRNILGYIDNGADQTIIFGAHFDHLGYGEDGNSMIRTGEKLIHNGADDNASGTAALIELARMLKKSKSAKDNYLFIAFSGEELGLYGSKYYVEHPVIPASNVNYMVNMDMVGRLNDSTKTITIGGYGTSPSWSSLLSALKNPGFNVKFDSSGTGPSDHTSFYRKDIPVLFFFTGLHGDYHRPSDDAGKINYVGELMIVKYIYALSQQSAGSGKLAFQKTREQQTSTSARFSVSMGIMPDYTFSGTGVKVDGVSEGRPALKAGIKAGDIVIKLGEYTIGSVESYMQALGKFKKGDATKVTVRRGNDEMIFDIVF